MTSKVQSRAPANAKEADDAWRFERKFFIVNHSLHQLERELVQHIALFREIFAPRQVNTVYFDSLGMKSFLDNVEGVSSRKKVRLRWYGDTFGRVEEPILEYKIKQGLLGRKERFAVRSFDIGPATGLRGLTAALGDSELPLRVAHEISLLKPKLFNSYRRKYYLSADGRFRLTIDVDMRFLKPDAIHHRFSWRKVDRQNLVLELKYSAESKDDDDAREIASTFPSRMTKSSKYVNGIELLYYSAVPGLSGTSYPGGLPG